MDVVPGAVLATGGIVAKFVGVTLTTVVATPKVSPLQAAPKTLVTTTQAATAIMRPIDLCEGLANTAITVEPGAARMVAHRISVSKPADAPLAESVREVRFRPSKNDLLQPHTHDLRQSPTQ